MRQPPICRAPVSAARLEPLVLVVPSALSAARNRIRRRASAAATHTTRHARLRVLGTRRHVGWRNCAVAGVCDAGASRACLSVASVCTLGQRRARTTRAVVVSTGRVCSTRAKLVVGLPRHIGAELLATVVLRAGSVCVPRSAGRARCAECRRRRCGVRVVELSRHVGDAGASCEGFVQPFLVQVVSGVHVQCVHLLHSARECVPRLGHIKWKRENKCWTFKDNTPKVKLYESFYQAVLRSGKFQALRNCVDISASSATGYYEGLHRLRRVKVLKAVTEDSNRRCRPLPKTATKYRS